MTIVQTTSGAARGQVHEGVAIHLGIPYASASRFRAPSAAAPGGGELDATAFGPIAPQAAGAQFQRADLVQDEACLSLNVWSPATPSDRPRPVMVWFHGGAFVHGSSASPLYDGAALARRGDVVVVTVNYRLGALGFLAHPDLAGDDGTSGNWGLLDQIEALRWVRANAAAFGGDPDNVTIFGESAGAVSVLLLCASPRTDGLIHRAVAQSGAALWITPEKAAENAERFAAELELDRVGDLHDAPVARVLHAQARTAGGGAAGMRTFVPTIDGVVLDRSPLDALADGAAAGVPLVVGTNTDEWKLFAPADPHSRDLDEDGLRRRLERRHVHDVDDVLTTFRSARAARGEATDPRDVWFAFESERFFRVPALAAAEAHAAHEPATFVYLFGWGSPAMRGWLGACHGLEIAYVFGTQGRPEVAAFTGGGPEADALAHTMMDAWVAFARTGDPSTAAHAWPAYDTATRPTMCFDAETRLERAPREPERAAVAASARVRVVRADSPLRADLVVESRDPPRCAHHHDRHTRPLRVRRRRHGGAGPALPPQLRPVRRARARRRLRVGGGDGPAFVEGPIRVVSLDIYNLDGDGNGVGCEPAPPKSSKPKDEVVIVIPPPAASVAATAVSGSPRFTG